MFEELSWLAMCAQILRLTLNDAERAIIFYYLVSSIKQTYYHRLVFLYYRYL
jgi:hypothetical protein